MNVLKPDKALHVYRLFAYGHGIRETARLAGVNRGTVARYRLVWDALKPKLQEAYDRLHDGDGSECDKICADLPDQPVRAMMDAWLDDQTDQPKSLFWDWR
jgi:hypothetical protein